MTNADGSTSAAVQDADAGRAPAVEVDAPGYHWVSTGVLDQGFNFAPFAASATQISIGRVLGQFASIGVGGAAAVAGGAAVVAAAAPYLRGPVLGAALNLTSKAIMGNTEVDEAAELAAQTLEKLEAELSSIEIANPETTGPDLPWGPQ